MVGIALIFTSFTITYRERITELERLNSLGMSKSQRRKMCLMEGLIIATIGIIIGMIIGYIISIFLTGMIQELVNNIGYKMFSEKIYAKFSMYFPIRMILFTILIIYISVSISAILPLRKLDKIDIVSGIKGNVKKKTKSKKVPFIISKLFKQEGELAYKYTKREKIRHGTMVSSITFSVFLFLTINGIVGNFLESTEKLTYDDYKINCSVENVSEVTKYLNEHNLVQDYLTQIQAFQLMPGTETSVFECKIEVPIEKISDVMLKLLNENKQTLDMGFMIGDTATKEYIGGSYYFDVLPYYFDEKTYNEILKRADISELKENECILLNTQKVKNSALGNTFELTKYKNRR